MGQAWASLGQAGVADVAGPRHIWAGYKGCRSARAFENRLRRPTGLKFCDRSVIGPSVQTYRACLRRPGVAYSDQSLTTEKLCTDPWPVAIRTRAARSARRAGPGVRTKRTWKRVGARRNGRPRPRAVVRCCTGAAVRGPVPMPPRNSEWRRSADGDTSSTFRSGRRRSSRRGCSSYGLRARPTDRTYSAVSPTRNDERLRPTAGVGRSAPHGRRACHVARRPPEGSLR